MSLERSDRLQDDLNRYLNEVRQRMDSEDQMIKEDIMHVKDEFTGRLNDIEAKL